MKRLLLALVVCAGALSFASTVEAGNCYQNNRAYGTEYSGYGYTSQYYSRVPHRHPKSYYYGYGNPSYGRSYFSPRYRGPGRSYNRTYSGVHGF